MNLQLLDIPFMGPRYTWSNNRDDNDLIKERLDRAYASSDWMLDYPDAILQNLPITISDHAPIVLHRSSPRRITKRPYQIESWSLGFQEVRDMVDSIWALSIAGSSAYVLSRKLAVLRDRLKAWCLDRKLFWGINWRELLATLQNCASNIHSIQDGVRFTQQHRSLCAETKLAFTYWRQRQKNHYLQCGDLPTPLLFRRLRPKSQHRNIHMLQRSDGEWISNQQDIADLIKQHFIQLFNPSHDTANDLPHSDAIGLVLRELNLPRLTNADIDLLMQPLSSEEVQLAMFSLAHKKSAGPDGFNVEFFKTYWAQVGDGVIDVVKHFFQHGNLLKEWNRTILVLIPKLNPPTEVNHLRPISLCNVLYKCIAKCMVNRMKGLLHSLIADYQTAFVPGCHMDDNILVAHELTHIINKQRRGIHHLAALKLDMNKAYDRVSWVFLLQVLQAYGFPAHWIRMIHDCISTATYRLLINGTITESITPSCGLRQGDPLSPYLFLFCMDILSRMTTLATDIRKFQGIKIGRRGPTISHLFFADDSMFFFKASNDSCIALKAVIQRFCAISGQMLSFSKSFVKFSPNVPETAREEYKNLLGMETRDSLGTYLGAPIDFQGSRVQTFTHLLDKASSRITSWSDCSLSQPAKVIIINSILIGALMHYLAVFRVPQTITNKLDGLFATFFWKDFHGKGIHWKKRSVIHRPKGAGGLGIRNVGVFNKALLMRKASRIQRNPHLLLSRVYNSSTRTSTDQMRNTNLSSWGRRGIVMANSLLNQFSHWKIGDGKATRVSTACWVKGTRPIFRDTVPLLTARTLRVADLILENQGQWNIRKVNALFEHHSARQIKSIELPPAPNISDEKFWPYTKSGEYTTKSGYAVLLQQQPEICSMTSTLDKDFFRVLWGSRIMPKWKVFLWKVWHNGLATKGNLFRRQLGDSSDCPICLYDVEDTSHLFRFCPLAIEAWAHRNIGLDHVTNPIISMRDWIRHWLLFFHTSDGYNGVRLPQFVGTLWSIWVQRNAQVFRQVRPSADSILRSLNLSDAQHATFAAESTHHVSSVRDTNLPPGFLQVQLSQHFRDETPLRIQIHADWDRSQLLAGLGWAVYLPSAHQHQKFGKFSYTSSGIAAMALACLKAITWATEAGHSNIIILTSSSHLLHILMSRGCPDINIKWTIEALRKAGHSLPSCKVLRVCSTQLAEAQQVAFWCRQHSMDYG
ncbi:uncharacterized protein LOC104883828 [Beta vulgaris subsp. vulgaris]|uniref:uncharacterized protein LOC104883828 n=1 Tax=Beta vulgaris subsp. vulgaris TaxID=3555 RepID=UPI0020374372|nr:uncharacterized protein LOC104883828 [Beta vulgaris subsp. vulgaris]